MTESPQVAPNGAWENLRSDVVEAVPFPERARVLFHIDEAMSWESVRDLEKMRAALLLVRNLAAQSAAPEDVVVGVDSVAEILDELLSEIAKGKRL